MKKMFLFAACLAVLACSCSENEEGTVKDVRASLKINANIGAPAVSRAEKTAWEAGDKLGLYVCNGTLGTPYNQNAVYTNMTRDPLNSNEWTCAYSGFPGGTRGLNYVFTDGGGSLWDNNFSKDWYVGVACHSTARFTPAPTNTS